MIIKFQKGGVNINSSSSGNFKGYVQAYGKKINPILFTTPGDVRDFAIDSLGATPSKDNPHVLYIPINKDQKDRAIQKNSTIK